jgi:hypothetical protein
MISRLVTDTGCFYRQQPWCSYALHFATFTSLAWFFDPLILLSGWWGTASLDVNARWSIFIAQVVWMFGFTKVIKLVGLFRRNPQDIVFLPVSIIFGYFHGFIKLYALLTLNMVRNYYLTNLTTPLMQIQTSWGSRPDGDLDDSLRMSPRTRPSDIIMTPRARPDDLEQVIRRTPKHRGLSEKTMLDQYEEGYPSIAVVAGLSPGSPFTDRYRD